MHSPARRAIVIGIDGAGMELVQHLVDLGHLPHLRDLMARGVHRPMLGTYPTLTPPAWTSFATASWPVTHEIMDWTIRVKGEPLSRAKWGIDTRFCKSEYFWNAAERAGKRPILIKFEMSWPPTVTHGIQVEGSGPGVSNFHQIAGYHLFVAGRWEPRPVGGQRDPETVNPSMVHEITTIDPVTLRRAAGWANLPPSVRPPMEVDLILRPLARGRAAVARGRLGVPKVLMGLIYASGDGGYDRVRICRERNAGEALADLGPRQWSRWWVETFEIDGAPVEGYVGMKLITLTPEAERFELFVPPVWPRTGLTYPAEIAQELDTHVGNFIQNPAREALGVIDDDTYFELLEMHHQRLADVAAYLTSHHSWDLLMIETHAPDYAGHFFLGQADPISGAPPDVVARCLGGVIRTMASVDRLVGRVASLADIRTLVTVVSDHGGTPSRFRSIDVGEILEQVGFLAYRDPGPTEQAAQPTIDYAPGEVPWMVPSNLMGPKREIEWNRSRAAPHGLVHIFINLAGREPGGIDRRAARIRVHCPAGNRHAAGLPRPADRATSFQPGDEPRRGRGAQPRWRRHRGCRVCSPAGIRRGSRPSVAGDPVRYQRPALHVRPRWPRRPQGRGTAAGRTSCRRGTHAVLPPWVAYAARRGRRRNLRGARRSGLAPDGAAAAARWEDVPE